MKSLYTLILSLLVIAARAQFSVGHISESYTDPARANRSITCELYYPADSNGDNVPVAAGQFPFVVFGHGFVMDYAAYGNITEALVSEGFVMIYVETEGGFAPVHNDFGLDLAFMADHFYDESANAASPFYGRLEDRCAIMGHSMGGGATWLAAATSSSVDCIAGLAPAETNPSAIDAASSVSVPAIVLSGSSDVVTAPADNHTPIFESTASACKYFVNIIDGSHCGYANTFLESGSLCDFGEPGFNGLSREEQQQVTHELLLAWFDVYLRDNAASNEVLQLYDDMQSNTETTIECAVSVEDYRGNIVRVYPNPGVNELVVECSQSSGAHSFALSAMDGRRVKEGVLLPGQSRTIVSTQALASGIYLLQLPAAKPIRWVKE
jgi:dienelactone hydrolase